MAERYSQSRRASPPGSAIGTADQPLPLRPLLARAPAVARVVTGWQAGLLAWSRPRGGGSHSCHVFRLQTLSQGHVCHPAAECCPWRRAGVGLLSAPRARRPGPSVGGGLLLRAGRCFPPRLCCGFGSSRRALSNPVPSHCFYPRLGLTDTCLRVEGVLVGISINPASDTRSRLTRRFQLSAGGWAEAPHRADPRVLAPGRWGSFPAPPPPCHLSEFLPRFLSVSSFVKQRATRLPSLARRVN